MKHFEKWFIIAFVGATLATSCVDDIKFGDAFLEKAPSVAVTQDTIFGKAEYARRFLWNTYSKLYYGLATNWNDVDGKMNTGMFECLSDCFHSHNSWDGLNRHYYSGTYTASTEDGTAETRFGFTKEETWQAIRSSWIFIENVDRVPDMDGNEKERLKDYLSKIMTSSNHLLSLINDVLDMSRIESGKVKIEESPCSIPIVIHDLRNILQTDIKAKRLDFFIDTVDVVDEDVICDKLRLNQILLNCMSNAMKYTKAGGTVGFRIIQKGHAPEGFADYDFVVKDNGIGMSEEFAEHIFEPFTREETSTVSRIPGTGLGMAITKNIVDMMGGTIKVKSELGVGSEFTISLRFKTTQQNSKRGVIKELNGFRALVADDSMDSCASVEKMLRTIGLRSEWTTSGKEAIFRAKYASQEKDPFQVYIIDWLMPDMNGIEVVRRIRMEIGDEVPIIILTAYDWADIEQEAREAGVTAFCAKPLFVSELYDVLQNASRPVKTKDKTILEVEAFKGKEILLVEDVELNREIAETILTEAGFHVNSVEDGKQAVDYMESEKGDMIDLILMDVMMPVMDGYEATQKIRQLEDKTKADIPIIAMTANAFEEDAKAAIEAGMNAHMAKPIRIESLYEIIEQYL